MLAVLTAWFCEMGCNGLPINIINPSRPRRYGNLRMSNIDDFGNLRYDGNFLQSLSDKLTSLIEYQISQQTGNNDTAIASPLLLKFSTAHIENIEFQDPMLADRYFNLPISQYSVLDSDLVSRAPNSDNKFNINIPLSFLNNYNSEFSSPSIVDLPSNLLTDMTVKLNSNRKQLFIESGDVYFTMTG